ncbi:XdhC family protein [Candidatus Amarobacter glycogenicus]|uniref:XdhC family protein n=1 Tax=Candidatus Amarobacter glycogenicus TaxID=3140699 RepID=UPI003136AE8F|nr:XdhC family protein [Dehalococcoidia bacterium]
MLTDGRLDKDSYIVLVRGHQYDIDCLLEVLGAPLAYIGMIGSQRRVSAVFQLLNQEQGIPPEKFSRITRPSASRTLARAPCGNCRLHHGRK